MRGEQAILDYISALKQGGDISAYASGLIPLQITVGKHGQVYFGRVEGENADVLLFGVSEGTIAQVTPHLVDPHDPTKGAYLRLEASGKTWEYDFSPDPGFFVKRGTRPMSAANKTLLDYISAVKDGRDLTPYANRLEPFELTSYENGSLYFGRIDKNNVQSSASDMPGTANVLVTPQLLDPADFSKGYCLVISAGTSQWRARINPKPNYLTLDYPEVPDGRDRMLEYIEALCAQQNLTNVAKALMPFDLLVGKTGNLAFGHLNDKGVQLHWTAAAGQKVKITPVLYDPSDLSKGAYLHLEAAGERRDYRFKAIPGY